MKDDITTGHRGSSGWVPELPTRSIGVDSHVAAFLCPWGELPSCKASLMWIGECMSSAPPYLQLGDRWLGVRPCLLWCDALQQLVRVKVHQVGCRLDGKVPEQCWDVAVNKDGSCFLAVGFVSGFCHSILLWGIRCRGVEGYAMCLQMLKNSVI